MTTEIERRLARLEDRASIEDLVVRYFLASDGDDLTAIGSSFTEDATFHSSGVLNASGPTEIVDFIAAARRQMGLTLHTPNHVLLTFHDGDCASGLVGAHLELVLGGTAIFGAVRYEDEYRRVAEGWRISRRDMRTVYLSPWRDVGIALESGHPVRWPGADPMPSDFPRPDSQSKV